MNFHAQKYNYVPKIKVLKCHMYTLTLLVRIRKSYVPNMTFFENFKLLRNSKRKILIFCKIENDRIVCIAWDKFYTQEKIIIIYEIEEKCHADWFYW